MSDTPTATPRPRAESTRGLNRVFKLIILVIAIAGVGSVFWFGNLMNAVAGVYSRKVEPMPFDSGVWKANEPTESHESVRLRMADDLVTNHLAAGLHESRLYQLIGFPDPYAPMIGYDMVYFLGTTPNAPGTDGLWLAIKLNNRGEVEFLKLTDE